MIKKMMLLAMAIAALAIPASASASGEFLDEGNPIKGEIAETFSGWFAFDTQIGNMRCDIDPEITFTSTGGTVNTLGITTASCKGSGALTECILAIDSLDGTPTVTPTSEDIDINGITMTHSYTNCPLVVSSITFSTVTANPDNPWAISTLTISGTGIVDPLGLKATATGELTAGNPGTIGIA